MPGLLDYLDATSADPAPNFEPTTKAQALGAAIAGENEKIAAIPFNIYSATTGKDSPTGDTLNDDAEYNNSLVERYPGNAFKTFSNIAGMILNPGIGLAAIPGVGEATYAGIGGLMGYGAEGAADLASSAVASRVASAATEGVMGALQQLPASVADSYNPQNKTFDGSQIVKDELIGFGGGVAIGSLPFRKAFETVTGKAKSDIPDATSGGSEGTPSDIPGASPEVNPETPTTQTNPDVPTTPDGSSRGPDIENQGAPPEANPVENIISGEKNPIDDAINKDSPDTGLIHATGGQTFVKFLSTQDMSNIQNVITDAVSRNIPLSPDVVGEMMAASPKFRAFVNDPNLLPTLKQLRNDLLDQESSISKSVPDKDAVSTSDPTVNSDITPKASPASIGTLNNLIQIAERVKAGMYDADPTKNFTNYMNERALSDQPTPRAEPEINGVKNLNIAKDGYESFQLDPVEPKVTENGEPTEKGSPETPADPQDQKADELFAKNDEMEKAKFEEIKLRRPILKRLLDCVGGY
jgi:hypothetical protein